MGVELKRNLQNTWWQDMVYQRGDLYGLDSSILTHQKTMHYSGHKDTFVTLWLITVVKVGGVVIT